MRHVFDDQARTPERFLPPKAKASSHWADQEKVAASNPAPTAGTTQSAFAEALRIHRTLVVGQGITREVPRPQGQVFADVRFSHEGTGAVLAASERVKRIKAVRGKYRHALTPTEEFLRAKAAERRRE